MFPYIFLYYIDAIYYYWNRLAFATMEGNVSDNDELPTSGIRFNPYDENPYDEGTHVPLSLPCGHTNFQQCTEVRKLSY